MHDSGFRILDFVAVNREEIPICRLSGCSDVLHIGGIVNRNNNNWSMDCLPKSGLLRIFCFKTITVGAALSSFEIY